MPICSDPNATTEICLLVDRDKPAETRPVFVSRYLTRRQAAAVDRLCTEALTIKSDVECFAKLMQAICIGIVGWKNFNDEAGKALELSDENISGQLTDAEVWELALNYPSRVASEEMRPKNRVAIPTESTSASGSPSPMPGEKSAETAENDAATPPA